MPPRAALALLLLSAACSDGGSGTTGSGRIPPDTSLRADGARTGGAAGDAIAAAMLRATAAATLPSGHASIRPGTGDLEARLRFHAEAQLEAAGLGAGAGASLASSALIGRLALAPDAPPDQNQDGTNRDETLALALARLAELTGAAAARGTTPALFGWSDGTADLAAAPGRRDDYAVQRTLPGRTGHVTLHQLGATLHATALAAGALLRDSRGSRPGFEPESGRRGLLLLQQAVAIDETLLDQMFMRADTRGLARLIEPATYDPGQGPRWLPASIEALRDERGAVQGWLPGDPGSELEALAATMRGALLLAWYASPSNPHPALRDVLNGRPFGPMPGARRGIRMQAASLTGGDAAATTYEDHVKPILDARCVACHGARFPNGGYNLSTYDTILKGGISNANFPGVVKGRKEASLLFNVLLGDTTPARRMPLGGPYLDPADIAVIGAWIDGGLQRSAPRLPAPGLDLLRVSLRNLRALHLDAATGGLHDRHEGDAASGFAAARGTGAALLAAAEVVAAMPELADARAVLEPAARFAMTELTEPDGRVHARTRIDLGLRGGEPDLAAQASLAAGLLAAGRVLGDQAVLVRGRAVATELVQRFWDPGQDLFTTRAGSRSNAADATTIALVLDALREAAFDGAVGEAAQYHDRYLLRLLPVLVLAEWNGRGELLGDGIPDTDGNGIREPAQAGGAHGRLPLFAGAIRAGLPEPPADEPVTWSRHIQPLFRANCAQCHANGNRQGNYALDTPALARIAGDSGGKHPLIVPGDPAASLLWRKLADRRPPVGAQMPFQAPPLDERSRELVARWIRDGATSR